MLIDWLVARKNNKKLQRLQQGLLHNKLGMDEVVVLAMVAVALAMAVVV